jgi:hypothetical protein
MTDLKNCKSVAAAAPSRRFDSARSDINEHEKYFMPINQIELDCDNTSESELGSLVYLLVMQIAGPFSDTFVDTSNDTYCDSISDKKDIC